MVRRTEDWRVDCQNLEKTETVRYSGRQFVCASVIASCTEGPRPPKTRVEKTSNSIGGGPAYFPTSDGHPYTCLELKGRRAHLSYLVQRTFKSWNGLDLVISEFTDNLARRLGAPGGAGAAAGPVQVGAPFGRSPLCRRHAACPQTGGARRAARLQHAVLRLRGAPVHRLKQNHITTFPKSGRGFLCSVPSPTPRSKCVDETKKIQYCFLLPLHSRIEKWCEDGSTWMRNSFDCVRLLLCGTSFLAGSMTGFE